MNTTPETIANNGALSVIASVVITLLVIYFKNKMNNMNKYDQNYNKQINEIFNVVKTQLEQSIEMNKSYRNDIGEIKKLILNESNMNISDFSTFMTVIYQNICMQLEKEMCKIIEINHIYEETISTTNVKVENMIDNIINNFSYTLQFVNYDTETLNGLIIFNECEKSIIKKMFKEIIVNYAHSESDYKKFNAIRSIEETVKYISNSFFTNLYDSIKKEKK